MANMQEFQITWRHVGQRRHLAPLLQERIATSIVRLAVHFPITVECLLHNGIEGVNDNVITVETNSGTKVVVIEDEFMLLFRLTDIIPDLQDM